MNILLIVFFVLLSNSLHARCSGPLHSYYVCNYKGQIQITDLHKKTKGWFFSDYEKGWYQVKFLNLKLLNLDGTANVAKQMNQYEFTYYNNFEPDLKNYKLNVVCNDIRFKNGPLVYYKIIKDDSDFCKKYPENSIIEQ